MKKRILIMVMALLLSVTMVAPVFADGDGDVEVNVTDPVVDGGEVKGETGTVSGGVTVNYDVNSDTPATPIWGTFKLDGADYARVIWEYGYTVTSPSGVVVASDTVSVPLADYEASGGGGAQLSGSDSYNWSVPIYFDETGNYVVEQSGTITGEYGDGTWTLWHFVPGQWVEGRWIPKHWEFYYEAGEYVADGIVYDSDGKILRKYVKPEPINHYDMPEWYPTINQFGLWFGGIYKYNIGDGNTLPTIEQVSILRQNGENVKLKVDIAGGTQFKGCNILRLYYNSLGELVMATTNGKALSFSNLVTVSVEQDGEWVELGSFTEVPIGGTVVP